MVKPSGKDRPSPPQYRIPVVRRLLLLLAVAGLLVWGYGLRNGDEIRDGLIPMPSTDANARVVGANDISFTTTAADPNLEPVDCLELLDSYRKGEIAQLRDHSDLLPYHKSYVRLTTTEIPFYLSTSDANVDHIRAGIFKSGDYYEKVMTETMQTIIRGVSDRMKARNHKIRPIMLDVGGNVGWFSMVSAAHGAEVFVFEPNVVNMVRLCESSVLNGWTASPNPSHNRVHPYLKGVGDEHGSREVMYKVDPKNPGSFSFSKETAENYASQFGKADALGDRLQLVTLDALARDQNWLVDDNATTTIAILKIDVEGLELKVLMGAQKLLKSHKVEYIFLEWKKDQVNNWEAMSTILLRSGYVLYKFGALFGPREFVTTKYANGKELAMDIAAIVKKRGDWENTNVLFRLAGIEGEE